MGIANTVRCVRCNTDTPLHQVRYLPDGKRIACLSCQGIVVKEEQARAVQERSVSDYQCARCHHQFRRAYAVTPKACPQCASPKLIRFSANTLTAGKLLHASKILDEK